MGHSQEDGYVVLSGCKARIKLPHVCSVIDKEIRLSTCTTFQQEDSLEEAVLEWELYRLACRLYGHGLESMGSTV
ncbi:hypothetical protein MHOCP_06880 [Moorella humiferrea]